MFAAFRVPRFPSAPGLPERGAFSFARHNVLMAKFDAAKKARAGSSTPIRFDCDGPDVLLFRWNCDLRCRQCSPAILDEFVKNRYRLVQITFMNENMVLEVGGLGYYRNLGIREP